MAEPSLAVLLRNGDHATATIKYALKCNDVAISYARTPIQIPIPQQSPELIDLGFYRPSITCTGVIDAVGEDTSNLGNDTSSAYESMAGMSSFLYTRTSVAHTGVFDDGGSNTAQRYFIPYKNALEEAVGTWIYLPGTTTLQLEIGDAKYPIDAYEGYMDPSQSASRYANGVTDIHATGGAIYNVAIQQARFSLNAAREDRYDFSLQFVAGTRLDIPTGSINDTQ